MKRRLSSSRVGIGSSPRDRRIRERRHNERRLCAQDCIKPVIEPEKITLTCADSGIRLKKLGWDEWNTAKVKGRASCWSAAATPTASRATSTATRPRSRC